MLGSFIFLLNRLLTQSRRHVLVSVVAAFCFFQLPAIANDESEARGEFIGNVDTEYPDWFKISFLELEEDIAEAAAEGKRLMLVFHQDGCPYCNVFIERNLAQVDIVETLQTNFDVIELNMWGDREVISVAGETYTEKEFAVALKVQFTPTVLFLNEQGEIALRLNGLYGPDRFRVALDYVVKKLEHTVTFADYIQSTGVVETNKEVVARDYFTGTIDQMASRPEAATKPLLIFFEQGGCSNCETLHETILSKPLSQDLLSEFDVYQVDMWGRKEFKLPDGEVTNGRQWSKTMDVSYAPTMILWSPDGTEVIRSESFFKTFHTQSILDYVASDAWRSEGSFQRYLSARADERREEGKTVDIWDVAQ